MRSPQQNECGGVPGQPGAGPRLAMLAFEAIGCSVAVFLHTGFGRRYLRLRAAAVVPLVLLYVGLWGGGRDPRADPGPMLLFLLAYVAMCLLARVAGAAARARGTDAEHSQYDGRPRLMRVLPWADEATVKKLVEPAVVGLAGCFAMAASAPLGLWLVAAAFCLMAVACLRDGWHRRRAADLTDAMIAQRQLAERVRGAGRN